LARFLSLDPFVGLRQDPRSLHRYLYAHANPVNGIDPNGQFVSVGTMLGILGALAVLATISFGPRLLSAFKSRNLPLLTISTKPIIVGGSGWSPAAAEGILRDAQRIWKNLAKINVVWEDIEQIDDDPALQRVQPNVDIPRSKFLPEWGKHMTFFNTEAGYEGGAAPTGYNAADEPVAGAFIAVHSGPTLAHEWGHHLLGEGHVTLTLMGRPPQMDESLLDEQIKKARANASKQPPWLP